MMHFLFVRISGLVVVGILLWYSPLFNIYHYLRKSIAFGQFSTRFQFVVCFIQSLSVFPWVFDAASAHPDTLAIFGLENPFNIWIILRTLAVLCLQSLLSLLQLVVQAHPYVVHT